MAELPPKCQNDLGTYFTLKKLLGLCVNEDDYISNQYDESPVSTPRFHQVNKYIYVYVQLYMPLPPPPVTQNQNL